MATASQIISKAESYIGTKESPAYSNNVVFNTDYYGHPVSGSGYPWCCAFVWDIFRMCGASQLFYNGEKTAYCPSILSWGRENDLIVSEGRKGDLILFDWDNTSVNDADHIGFIYCRNSDGSYTTIEGNTSLTDDSNGGEVMKRNRSSCIRAIIRPKYDAEEPNYVVDGYDYTIVYNYDYYIAHNEDVVNYYGKDKQAVFNHFLKAGMNEGRQAIESFNVRIYKDNYEDLRKAFDKNMPEYYQHYIKYGKKENRVATYHIVPVTYYGDMEYNAVFDADYYIAKYPDLLKTYGKEKDKYDKLIYHFVKWGMKERRQAKSTFNVDIYKGNYQDLQIAYGNDYPAYYTHYIKWGMKEGRVADHAIRKVEVKYHTVQDGDTISKIATQYKTTVEEILKLNDIKFDKGQKIRVK